MGVFNAAADVAENAQPLLCINRGFQRIADGRAFHIFHDEIGLARERFAAIEKLGDIGMLQRRQGLALIAQPFGETRAARDAAHDLDGDLVIEIAGGALAQPDGAHAAAPQQANDPVLTNRFRLGFIGVEFRKRAAGGQRPPGPIGAQQRQNPRAQTRILIRSIKDPLFALGRRQRRRFQPYVRIRHLQSLLSAMRRPRARIASRSIPKSPDAAQCLRWSYCRNSA